MNTSTVSDNYAKLGNLIIQWGSASSGTITFPKPFADTSYKITLGLTVRIDSYAGTISEKTTTSFNYYAINNRSSDWIAIGY